MTKILSLAAALLCTISANAFVPNARPMGVRKSTSIGPTLEGRLIEGEIKPTNNFILVKVAPDIEKTEGGIILAGKVRYLWIISPDFLEFSSIAISKNGTNSCFCKYNVVIM